MVAIVVFKTLITNSLPCYWFHLNFGHLSALLILRFAWELLVTEAFDLRLTDVRTACSEPVRTTIARSMDQK
jgi:hypothetical protein